MNKGIVGSEAGWPVAWLAVLAMAGGCAEAPRTADEDAGSEEVSADGEEARTDDASDEGPVTGGEWQGVALDAGAPREKEEEEEPPHSEAEADAPQSEPERKDERELASDAGPDAARDASEEPAPEAGHDAEAALDSAPDGSLGDASPPPDPCDGDRCQHGGVCSADADRYTCACPEGYAGEHCERKLCASVTIRAPADVEQHRECGEIRGDLNIASVGLTEISADDFPFLTKVTGNLIISGPQATDGAPLTSVTLAALREVEGAVAVTGVAVVEFGGSGPLRELHLPALERIGGHDTLGLAVYQASLKVLDLPALATIEGAVLLDTLFDLCTLNAQNVERVGGKLTVSYVPTLPAAELEALRSAAEGSVSERLLGCCAASPEEQVACDGFTEKARALYCAGC